MIIGIASDHQGYKRKQQILEYLRSKNYEVIDYGTDSNQRIDYNEYAITLCENLKKGNVEYGILICGTGIGMSIVANKIKGIMCAKVDNKTEAVLSRKHNNVKVISLSKRKPLFLIKRIIETFLHTPFSDEVRYKQRIRKIEEMKY